MVTEKISIDKRRGMPLYWHSSSLFFLYGCFDGAEDIPSGYCVRVFHIEARKELIVGIKELKNIFKKSSQ